MKQTRIEQLTEVIRNAEGLSLAGGIELKLDAIDREAQCMQEEIDELRKENKQLCEDKEDIYRRAARGM